MQHTHLPDQKTITLLLAIALCFALFSCQKKLDQTAAPVSTNAATKIAPDGFTYSTVKNVTVNLSLLTNNNLPLNGVPVTVYTCDNGNVGKTLYTGISSSNGVFTATFSVPASTDTLILDPAYLGLMRNAIALINGTSVNASIGGSAAYGGNVIGAMNTLTKVETAQIKSNSANATMRAMDINGVKTTTKFTYLSPYDGAGRPTKLVTPDVISAGLLQSINASLPENKRVPDMHPDYLTSDAESNIVVEKDAEVWITFVSEGAGYRNALAFYTYPTGKAPESVSDITELTFIFPNASLKGSNGSMLSGDKISLGIFPAGTTIGLAIFSDGWNGRDVGTNGKIFFSNANLNPETKADLKRHTVLLKYTDTYIIGFEDIFREYVSCDQDFNDVLIYASSNPIEAISTNNVRIADTPKDADGDGVSDTYDQFPTDPERAFINYYPAKDSWATIAFEDQWPVSGDYDLNDLVVNYQYSWVSNAKNNIVELFGSFTPIAAGASFKNGFGVQFPFAPSDVKSVTGYKHIADYIKMSGNGTEAGQQKAVIIPFDNYNALINNSDGAYFINTNMNRSKVVGETVNLTLTFASPISSASFGTAPFNPFLISNMRRGYEVHLPGQIPTSLVDATQFGKGVDGSTPSANIYYVTKENYPWALNFTDNFVYPAETNSIANAYTNFLAWAASSGTSYKDWYSNTGSGYRDSKLLYIK